jgi:hypothetical protein
MQHLRIYISLISDSYDAVLFYLNHQLSTHDNYHSQDMETCFICCLYDTLRSYQRTLLGSWGCTLHTNSYLLPALGTSLARLSYVYTNNEKSSFSPKSSIFVVCCFLDYSHSD